jgi:hypothetical protein
MNSLFDVLEPRVLLSAPVATVESFSYAADTMSVWVRYSADTGIDESSIDPNDMVLAGPGLVRHADEVSAHRQGADIVAWYRLRRAPEGVPHDQWPNGTYNLGIPAGEVRSGDGVGIAGTGTGSHWLWFPDTYVELDGALIAGDGWSLWVRRWMRHPDAHTTLSTSVRVSGPTGDQVFESQGVYPYPLSAFVFRGENADGLWDFTDTGTYSFAMGEYEGAQLVGYRPVQQQWYWMSSPKIEILSSDFSDTDVLVTARFSGRSAIDPSSITWATIGLVDPLGRLVPATPDHYYTVDPQPDGSIIGTFKRGWNDNRSWGSLDNGDWRYEGVQRVQDIDGNISFVGVITHQAHAFTRLSTDSTEMAAYAQEPRTLTFKMTFPALNVDLATLGDDDIRLELNGSSYQLSLAYTYGAGRDSLGHPMITAAYTLTLPQSERLDTGTARFYMNTGAISISGQPSSEQFMGSWWLWFN